MKLNFKAKLLGALALLAFGTGAALALTNPPSYSPRVLQTQTTVHFRKTVNFNDANIATGVKFGALPQGAYITGVRCYVSTAFNAGTTNSIAVGTTASGSDVLAAGTTAGTNCVAATTGNQNITSAAGLGLAVAAGTPTGSNGGFDLFARFTQTGTAATAGQVTIVIDYIANDDQ
jgi:hypothetical protein